MNEFKARVMYQKLKKQKVKRVMFKNMKNKNLMIFVLFEHRDLLLNASCYSKPGESGQIDIGEAYESIVEDIEYINSKVDQYIYPENQEIEKQGTNEISREIGYILDDQLTNLKKMKTKDPAIVGYDWEKDFETFHGEINNYMQTGLTPLKTYEEVLRVKGYDPKLLLDLLTEKGWYDIKDIDYSMVVKRENNMHYQA